MTTDIDDAPDPDWDSPMTISLTPELLVHALMENASAVHTGWQSCVQEDVVLSSLIAMDDSGASSVRLVEQEFADEEDAEAGWHDWAVEIRIGAIVTTGHWQLRTNAAPLDWEWHAREAEQAFDRACVLLGRRVRRGLVVDEPVPRDIPPRSSRH